jgi:hypothetical protein
MIYTATNGLKVNACNCICHTEGIGVRHVVACCNVSYEKYINTDGEIDQRKLTAVVENASIWLANLTKKAM